MVPDRNEVPANKREAVKYASFAVCISEVLDSLVTLLDAKFCERFILLFYFFLFLGGGGVCGIVENMSQLVRLSIQ